MNGSKLHKLPQNRIEVIFDGGKNLGNDVTLAAFYQQLQKVHRVLTKIEYKKSGGETATNYTVVDLSHSSPARVVIQVSPLPKKTDFTIPVMQGFNEALYAVNTGKGIDAIDTDILEDLRELSKPVGKQFKSFVISTHKESFELSERITKQIEAELAAGETEHGIVEGVLEQINIHGDQKYFHIYADSAFKKLKCRFPADLVDTATSAIGRKISASGILKYRANAFLPFEIIVEDIEIFSADLDLPDFDDLRGKAPNIMGGKTSEEFISELRNDWY